MTIDFKIAIDGKDVDVSYDESTKIYEASHPTFGSFCTRTIVPIYRIVRALAHPKMVGHERVEIDYLAADDGVSGRFYCNLTSSGKIVSTAKFSCRKEHKAVSFNHVYDDLVRDFFGLLPVKIPGIGNCEASDFAMIECTDYAVTKHDTIASCILVRRALTSPAPGAIVLRASNFGYTLEIDNDGVTYTPEQDKSTPIRSSNIDSLLHHLHTFEVNKTLAAELPKMIESTPLNYKYTALDQVSQIRKQVFVLANITNEHRLCSTDLIGQMLKLLAETETQILTDD